MKLKFDEKGNVVVQDGKPVYVSDEGKDIAFDYAATLATISRLNGEAKAHREAKEEAIQKLKAFEGIEDPHKARDALETVSKLDSKKLLDTGKVDELKAELEKAYKGQLKAVEDKYKPVEQERDALKHALNEEKIGGSFARSKFIAEKLAIPADLAKAAFGSAFSLEDGKIVAKDASGNRIYSRARPGEIADFDEAFELLVDQYPHRDSIIKSSGATGSGAMGSNGASGGGRRMRRAEFDALDPSQQAKIAIAREIAIVD